ncbi:MAG: hypothetical protein GX612_09485 [Bacteroidales bacterium]|nr:hypothetical protein [Bacteroidales bacterium]
MKNLMFISILITINISVFAQLKFADKETLASFLKTKTYIVLEDAMYSDFNNAIKGAAEKHWKITEYEIIDLESFEKLSKNPKLSFLIVSIGEATGIPGSFSLLNLIMGDASGDINKMKEIIIAPLSYYSEESDEEPYAYKLGGLLEAFQAYVRCNPGDDWKLWVNENKKELKNKELWVVSNDLSADAGDLKKIGSVYPYPIKIVSQETIRDAIDKKISNVAFVHKVGVKVKDYCMKMIISCSDGKLLYINYHKISDANNAGLLIKDFEALTK